MVRYTSAPTLGTCARALNAFATEATPVRPAREASSARSTPVTPYRGDRYPTTGPRDGSCNVLLPSGALSTTTRPLRSRMRPRTTRRSSCATLGLPGADANSGPATTCQYPTRTVRTASMARNTFPTCRIEAITGPISEPAPCDLSIGHQT